MRSPSLLASVILHSAAVVAVAWWVPMKRSGMPGEGGSTAEFNAVLLDEPAQAAAEDAPSIELVPALPAQPEPEVEKAADLSTAPVIASQAWSQLPAPPIAGIETSKPTAKSSRPPRRSRSTTGLAGSRSGGGGGGGSYIPPRYARCPAPSYPPSARDARQSGLALLRVAVDADGAVVRVALTRSTGSPALDGAAVATVRGWRFIPAQLDGASIPSEVEVPVRFVL